MTDCQRCVEEHQRCLDHWGAALGSGIGRYHAPQAHHRIGHEPLDQADLDLMAEELRRLGFGVLPPPPPPDQMPPRR